MSGGFEPLPIRLRSSNKDLYLSAEQHARICADLVACVGMAPVIKARIERKTNTENTVSVLHERTMLDTGITVVTNGTNSEFIVQVPSGGRDSYGKPGSFRIRGASYTLEGSSAAQSVVTWFDNNFISIEVIDAAGTPLGSTDTIGTLKVW